MCGGNSYMGMEKATILLAGIFLMSLSGCAPTPVVTTDSKPDPVITSDEHAETSIIEYKETTAPTETTAVADTEAVRSMVLMIGNTEVPVVWEDNASVDDLRTLTESGLSIEMSMYGGFEQVGSIGQSITSNDEQTETSPGDIVLYSGNNIVIFYGSNSWAYTRLGRIDLSEEELRNLLSNGDVTITITIQ
jgi:hypothetical protein